MTGIDDAIKNKEVELRELKEKKQQKELKEKIKQLEDYSDEEKIAWFDKQYNGAYDTLMEKIRGEYNDDGDEKEYVWEDWLQLLGKDIFDVWNKY